MPLKLTTLCSLLLLSITCAFSQVIKIDSSSARTLRIDPQNARGATVSQLYDQVEFIPLETTKESLFGNINQLKMVDGHYVFMDYDTKALLIFTQQGKFRAKITANQMPVEDNDKKKQEFWSFIVVREDNKSLLMIRTEKYELFFDLDGKQVKKRSVKEVNTYTSPFRFTDEKTSVIRFYNKIIGKDTSSYQLAYVHNNKDTTGYFFSKSNELWGAGEGIYKTSTPDEYIYYNFYGYDLFKLRPHGISLAYRLIFPATNSLPKDIGTNPIYKGKVGDFLQKNKEIYYGLSNTYLLDDQLYLKVQTYGWEKNTKRSIIYHLKTGEMTSLEDIEPDVLSYYLPVNDAGTFYDFQNKGFLAYEDGYFYTSYSSLAMFTFKEQSESKKAKYPPVLENYFKTSNKKSNPVIIKLKPKKA